MSCGALQFTMPINSSPETKSEQELTNFIGRGNTVKTLKIGTPRLTTLVVLNIKQFDFIMQ